LRLLDALEGELAAVVEDDAGGGATEGADDVGDEGLAGSGSGSDAGGDVDGAAVNVAGAAEVLVADDVAGMDADMQQ
jgi:hypothetical protein